MSNDPADQSVRKMPPLELPKDLSFEYANIARIAHTPAEIVLDFASLLPGGGSARVSSRIVMSPLGAKLFHRALAENLLKYEANFGEIRIPGDVSLADHLFRPPASPDLPSE